MAHLLHLELLLLLLQELLLLLVLLHERLVLVHVSNVGVAMLLNGGLQFVVLASQVGDGLVLGTPFCFEMRNLAEERAH